MFTEVALNSIDKTIEPIGLDDSAKSFDYFSDDQSRGFENSLPDSDLNKLVDLNTVDVSDKCRECIDDCTFSKSQGFVVENEHPDGMQLAPDVTLKDMQTVQDVNVKDVTCNESQDPMIHMIDELTFRFRLKCQWRRKKIKKKWPNKYMKMWM